MSSISNTTSEVPKLFDKSFSCIADNWENFDFEDENVKATCNYVLMVAWNRLLGQKNQNEKLKFAMKDIQNAFAEKEFLYNCKLTGSYDVLVDEYKLDNRCKSAVEIENSLVKEFGCEIDFVKRLIFKNKIVHSSIEKAVIEKYKLDGTYDRVITQCVRREILEKNVYQLFQKLADTFGLLVISSDCSGYNALFEEQNEALQKIWSDPRLGIARQLNLNELLRSVELNKLMPILTDINIKPALSKVTHINFNDCQLKTIPPEILNNLPFLTHLLLSRNLLTNISQDFSRSKVKFVDLSYNDIKIISKKSIKNSSIEDLNLAHNQIEIIPSLCVNLHSLVICYNKIKEIPDLSNNFKLENLYVNDNQIEKLPETLISSQVKWLRVTHNRITNISNAFENRWLNSMYLYGNPFLFTFYRDQTYVNRDLFSLESAFRKKASFDAYPYRSNFSKLLKMCVGEKQDVEVIKTAFMNLSSSDKNLVYEMVYLEAGIVSTDAQWGEHHVFDDENLFFRALRRAVSVKFDRLSAEQKNKVYGEVYILAEQPETNDARWGERNAFECVPRLVDAMEKAGF